MVEGDHEGSVEDIRDSACDGGSHKEDMEACSFVGGSLVLRRQP